MNFNKTGIYELGVAKRDIAKGETILVTIDENDFWFSDAIDFTKFNERLLELKQLKIVLNCNTDPDPKIGKIVEIDQPPTDLKWRKNE